MFTFSQFITEDSIKYPRTFHLPWSLGRSDDDKVLHDTSHFNNKQIIMTEKMDGENTTLYSDKLHARSLDSSNHESQAWVKQFHASIKHEIPKGYRICGENLYAKHALSYDNLSSYFLMFSIWNDNNLCLSWKDTLEWASLLNVKTVPIIYEGIYNEEFLKTWYDKSTNKNNIEGYVIRLASSFHYSDFNISVAKFVRAGHVQPNAAHWKTQKITPNKLGLA